MFMKKKYTSRKQMVIIEEEWEMRGNREVYVYSKLLLSIIKIIIIDEVTIYK